MHCRVNDADTSALHNSELVHMLSKEKGEGDLKVRIAILEAELGATKWVFPHNSSQIILLSPISNLYWQLLECIDCAPVGAGPSCKTGTLSEPFLTILQSVRDVDTTVPYMREEYPKVVYWTKTEYLKDFQNGCGKLQTTHTMESGSAGFLENQSGVVLSKDDQQRCRDVFCPLLYTLLYHNLAPTTWSKCTHEACKYILRSLHIRFLEFCLCADDWKADMFMSLNYSHWSDWPRDATSEGMVKEEVDVDSPSPANLLQAQGLGSVHSR